MHRSIRLLCSFAVLASLLGCPTGPVGRDDDDTVLTLYDEVPVGALVVTEILAHPNVGRPEFVEVINASGDDVDLIGCKLVDGGNGEHEYDVRTPLLLAPGEYALLAGEDTLGGPDGDLPADVVWSDITLAQTDESEIVGLRCPDGTGARQVIDEVAFHWNGLDLRRGHSWQLAISPDAVTNDDPDNWCEAPTQDDAVYAEVDGVPDYGSPGEPAICETPGGATPSVAGDVVISEILVDEFTGLREWFELHNPGDEPLDLRGCVLGDEPVVGGTDPNTHTMDADIGLTVIEPGGWLSLSKTETALTADGSVSTDYPYGSLGFNNSELQLLWLDCPGSDGLVRIDQVIYDWGDYGTEFEGRSLSLSATALDAEDNDDPANWCLAADEDTFWTTEAGEPPESFFARGTPGEANPACPVPDPFPLVGEVVFTEILARSAGTEIGTNEEWFEIKNLSDHAVSIDGCTVRNDDFSGEPDDHVIEAPLGLSIEAGTYAVLAKSSAADTISCGLPYDYLYGTNIGLANDDPETLELICPGDVVVDVVNFDGDFLPGIPWQLEGAFETALGNDASENWCSTDEVSGYTWTCTVGADTNYGTPGSVSSCP